jgi:hypothetical protein
MNVDTSEFRALADRVAALEAEFAASIPLLRNAFDAGVGAGVESVLGRPAAAPRPRPRHLQAVPGSSR